MKVFLKVFTICLLLSQVTTLASQKSSAPIRIICGEEVVLGDVVKIGVTGLPAKAKITLTAELIDRVGRVWRSSADFIATDSGKIDTSKQAPESGSYSGVDFLGLFWSMLDTKEIKKDSPFMDTDERSIVTFKVLQGEKVIAERQQKRWRQKPGVISEEVKDQGLVATFYKPQANRPRPGIILVGGSEGGIRWQKEMGGILASHGYATLALAYFNMETLPAALEKVPLEYFQTAISWMSDQPSVDRKQLAVFGVSKGGELALLIGSYFPQIKAVAAYVPSSVVFQSISPKFSKTSSWSFNGQELPFVPYGTSEKYLKSRKLVDLYEASLENKEAFERAAIKVEKIQGPVLLLSGRADELWNSSPMSEQVIARLKQHKHRFFYKHIAYDNAGHSIARPGYVPTSDTVRIGGTAQGNAHAQAGGWQEVLAFLSKSLKNQ